MDDIVGLLLGIVAVVAIIYAVVYIVIFLVLAAMVLVPCFFLGRQFYRQLSLKYRLTEISTLVLLAVGFLAVVLSMGLVELLQEPHGLAYVLMVPLFLCMATATLGLWGLSKVYPLWWAAIKAERNKGKGESEIRRLQGTIAGLSGAIGDLEAKHGTLLEKRGDLGARVRQLCTGAGDQRFRMLLKEEFERKHTGLSAEDLEKRLARFTGQSDLKEEQELAKCLLEVALIDIRTGNESGQVRAKAEQLTSLKRNKQRLERGQESLERQVRDTREILTVFRSQKIVLN